MKHPKVKDLVQIRFAGLTRTGSVVEVTGHGKDKRWVVLSGGIYYPGLTLEKSGAFHIIKYVDIDNTRTCPTRQPGS